MTELKKAVVFQVTEYPLPDEGMDKYAVDESGDPDVLEKAATDGCPACGGRITRHGDIVSCENCGTAPFEKRK